MKEIRITRLTLENFKCHEALTLDFMGQSVSIHGDNATGKTSIYDALTWLLFGKDSHGAGEKNIDIKPLTSTGEIKDHAAITAVEAILEVDGVPMSLKRTLREIWSTKRGASEATYDGNTCDYFVDGVPCKKYEYDRRIGEVIGEDTFRMLTGVAYFASEMDWKDRRKALFEISGALTDKDIMATDARFDELTAQCGTLTVDDLKKKTAAERKGLIGVRDETPAKLSALMDVQRDLSGNDFAAARSELQRLTAEKEAGQDAVLERRAAIAVELENDDADLNALSEEARAITAEIESRRAAEAQREEIRKMVANGAGEPVARIPVRENEREQRARALKETGRMTASVEETRAILISSGNLATPTDVSGINDAAEEDPSSLLNHVWVENCEGMGADKVAYVVESAAAADDQTEGSEATTKEPTFGYVTITPTSVACKAQISKRAPYPRDHDILQTEFRRAV